MENTYVERAENTHKPLTAVKFLRRLYYSSFTLVLYLVLLFVCILVIFVNSIIQSNIIDDHFSLNRRLLIIESSICIITLAEIILRIYLKPKYIKGSLISLADLIIVFLSTIGLILTRFMDPSEILGNPTCDTLIFLRNFIYIIRALILVKQKKEAQVERLKIALSKCDKELIDCGNDRKISQI